MISPDAIEEYAQAVKLGQKEVKELSAQGKQTNPKVLDDILGEKGCDTALDLGLMDIPADRIVGTRTAGRITAFSPSFWVSSMSRRATNGYQSCAISAPPGSPAM